MVFEGMRFNPQPWGNQERMSNKAKPGPPMAALRGGPEHIPGDPHVSGPARWLLSPQPLRPPGSAVLAWELAPSAINCL